MCNVNCRIIESILGNFDWFFDDQSSDSASALNLNLGDPSEATAKPEDPTIDAYSKTIAEKGNENLLLSNLQKLESSGKVHKQSPARDVLKTKELVSGIISAANRKKQIPNQRPSMPSNLSHLKGHSQLEQVRGVRHDSPGPGSCSPTNGSRRNSESVIHSAVAIAAAVPHLQASPLASNASSLSNIPARLQV